MKKITKATVKSFVKKNLDNLYKRTLSDFNGMIDMVENVKGDFKKVNAEKFDLAKYGWGICATMTGRDYFLSYEDDKFIGFNVYNSCGEYLLVTKK